MTLVNKKALSYSDFLIWFLSHCSWHFTIKMHTFSKKQHISHLVTSVSKRWNISYLAIDISKRWDISHIGIDISGKLDIGHFGEGYWENYIPLISAEKKNESSRLGYIKKRRYLSSWHWYIKRVKGKLPEDINTSNLFSFSFFFSSLIFSVVCEHLIQTSHFSYILSFFLFLLYHFLFIIIHILRYNCLTLC